MAGVGVLFMAIYFVVVVGTIVIVLLSLWRGMRAQEEMARTLSRIEQSVSRWSPAAGPGARGDESM